MTPAELNPLTFPLHGSRLIEASAGTGKTWTIAALYVRLVLGHGLGLGNGDKQTETPVAADASWVHTSPANTVIAASTTAFTRPLQPAEILVMTFTRAATRELSDRIRQRLLQTARCFRGQLPASDIDDFLQQLLASYADNPVAMEQAAHRLALAADVMDDAAVFTIDAWCQRMLREHAFDSASLFDEELVDDEQILYHDAARDYWRSQVYALSDSDFAKVVQHWSRMQALEESPMRSLVKSAHLLQSDVVGESLEEALRRGSATQLEQAAILKAPWREAAPMLQAWFVEHRANINGNVYRNATVLPFFTALTAWADTPDQAFPGEAFDKAADKWDLDKIKTNAKGGATLDPPAQFGQIATLRAALADIPTDLQVMMQHAARAIDAHMQRVKLRRHQFTFADLLSRLKAALEGPNGEALRKRIIAQYPVALIDEFQDTSPDQYRIFDCLYQVQKNDPSAGLFLIGDPKQAIYGFRGADIHSYLAARAATAGRHYRLGTNYRSTDAVVAAVNHVFGFAEGNGDQPGHPRGAFGFRGADSNPLPFEPTSAAGRTEQFTVGGTAVAALTLCIQQSDSAPTKGDFQTQMAAHCAEAIVTWLNDESAAFCSATEKKRLRPGDIAVLVRDRYEAAAMQLALRRRRIASVYLSDKDSVFDSPEAADVLRWLTAFANPLDGKLGRIAFATRTAALSLATLHAFSTDDLLWESCIEQLKRLQKIWQRQGVLAALRQFIQELVVLAPTQQEQDGERRLTNLLHLAELLQAQSRRLDGEHALIRWLSEQIDDDGNNEEHTLRLESDAQLVQIITVFKAKGLEYPLVFIPFAVAARPFSAAKRQFIDVTDDQTGVRKIDFEMSASVVARKDQARLEEELRLIYVALTRARHALWCGMASINDEIHVSAIGYLLNGGRPTAHAQLPAVLTAHWGSCPATQLALVNTAAESTCFNDDSAVVPLSPALIYSGKFARDWSITSYTALSKGLHSTKSTVSISVSMPAPISATDEHLDTEGSDGQLARATVSLAENDSAQSADLLKPSDERDDERVSEQGSEQVGDRAGDCADDHRQPAWHRFPRGVVPGQFLHAQLEWIATNSFDSVDTATFAEQLAARCQRSGWGHRKDDTIAWLRAVVHTPLPQVGVSLRQLTRYQAEMEFWLPIQQLRVAHIDRLCQQVLVTGTAHPRLTEREVTGMLRGFQDLVFEHEGRYWVLDYKSNWLGNSDADYQPQALAAAVAAQRYEVQGMIYLIALHRLLKTRLGAAYVPAEHLGGALFLFMRGIGHPQSHGCHHIAPDLVVLEELDLELNRTLPDQVAA